MDRSRGVSSVVVMMVTSLGVIAAIYFGRGFLIPLALAVLVSLLLAPLVNRLQHWKVGRIPSVVIVVVLAFGLVAWLSYIVARQASELARRLPEYRQNIVAKTQSLRGPLGGALGRVYETATEIGKEMSEGDAKAASARPKPLQVEVVKPNPTAFQLVSGVVTALIETLGVGAVVVVLVVFMLIYRDDLRDRIIHLAGVAQINVTTQTLDEAAGNVSRYLLLQTIVNISHGVAFGLGLFLLGIPNALLWGFLGAMLRYIPYLGPWIAGGFPIVLSLAAFSTWTQPILIVGFIIILELVSNNVIEPWVYGKRTGLSPLAVVVSAVFWAWLWGGVGLILAVPLTVCMVTLGRHLPAFRFLNTLLGQNPGLDPEVRLYHRLLARDPEAASDLVEALEKGRTFQEVCEKLFLPTLALEKQNRQFGDLEEERARALRSALRDLIEEAAERSAPPPGEAHSLGVSVICIPAADEADEIAAAMMSHLLNRAGVTAEVLSASLSAGEKVAAAEMKAADLICLSALAPGGILPVRYLLKRLRRRDEDPELVVGLWGGAQDSARLGERLHVPAKVRVATTFSEAMRLLQELAAAGALRKHSEVKS